MVRYLALIVAVVATLVTVDAAQARGRRGGCPGGNCNVGYSNGCSGGNCYAAYGSAKTVSVDQAAPAVVAAEPATPAVVAAPSAASRYTSNVRRGWFGWRRS